MVVLFNPKQVRSSLSKVAKFVSYFLIAVGQASTRAAKYFKEFGATVNRTFFTDSDHWFLLKILAQPKAGKFIFASKQYDFSLTAEEGG